MKQMEHVAIVGMGALGLLFGEVIQRNLGPSALTFVADAARAERYREMRFTVNGVPQQFTITPSGDATPADLVIVAVKATALEQSLETMKNCIGPDTTIISVLNGISSEGIIGARYGLHRIVYTVAQGMDAVKLGAALTYSKTGTLNIGSSPALEPGRLDALVDFFQRAGVPYVLEDDILYRMWAKFMLNVGINQSCMAYETTYGGALNTPEVYDTMMAAMKEVQTLAACEGITLPDEEREGYVKLLYGLTPGGMPSMRQDGLAHRPSEVELFAGTVCRMAADHGLAVPVNQMLYDRIRAMEAAY